MFIFSNIRVDNYGYVSSLMFAYIIDSNNENSGGRRSIGKIFSLFPRMKKGREAQM